MAFKIQNWYRGCPSFPVVYNADNTVTRQVGEFYYNDLVDAAATIEASGYFNDVAEVLDVSMVIQIVDSTGEFGFYNVTSVTNGVVTIAGVATIGMGGVGPTQLGAVAGAGLGGGNGSALSVNVDDSTIEINADTLRVKTGGITAVQIAAGAVANSELDPAIAQVALVTVSSAELLALRATPKTLVAAPASGKTLQFINARLLRQAGTAYTETTDNMAIRYTNGSGVIVSATIETTGLLDATAATESQAIPVVDAIVASTGADAQALVLHNIGNGEYTDGTGNLLVAIEYRIVSWS